MKKYIDTGKKDTRSGFGAGLTELGKTNPNVVALCADLTGSLKMDEFKTNHPERFFSSWYRRGQYDGPCGRNDHWGENSIYGNILLIFLQGVYMIKYGKVLPIVIKM